MPLMKTDGTTYALAYHIPEEWAEVRYQHLIALGCSSEYAAAVAAQYAPKELR